MSDGAGDASGAGLGDAHLRLLSDAGRVLGASLAYETTLANLAKLVVPGFADWCSIDLLDEAAGEIRRVSVVHMDPAKVALAEELRRRRPPRLSDPQGVALVLRTGETVWAPEIPEELIVRGAQDAEHARILLGLQIRSYICVPLAAPGRVLGALTLVTAESGRVYGAADVSLAEELGRRAGAAVDHARLFAALKRSEETFQAFMDHSPTSSWITDAEGRVVYCSVTYRQTFKLPTEDVVGKLPGDLYPREFAEKYAANIRAVAETGKAVEVEEVAPRLDGTVGEFWVYKFPIRDAEGRTLVGGVAIDVTERKRADREREQALAAEQAARAEAERANGLKDEFLATLSHELRTPLNAILGWSQYLEGANADPETVAEGVAVISRNARAQTQLIEDLLDMSRIVSGKLRLDMRPVKVAEVVAAALESVMPAAGAKRITVEQRVEGGVVVMGDASRLQQVVWNLLTNAVKFTPEGGRVELRTERVNGKVEVTVSDDGQGVAPEFLAHMFERFRQADASTTRRHGGLGIGLALVKQLVELHGGTVRAASAGEGRGATFTVSLPVAAVAAKSGDAGAAAASAGGLCAEKMLEGVKVLLIDDDADGRFLGRRILEECGARVVTAGSAVEGLELLKRERPDVLVSDIGMPEADGYALIHWVRRLTAAEGGRTPAVALTAFARSEDRRRALLAGYQSHVPKPVEPAELVTVVAGLVGRAARA